MSAFLIIVAVLVLWVGSLRVKGFGACWRCWGRGVLVRKRKGKPPKSRPCPACEGVGRRQRAGSQTVHQLSRRVERYLVRQRRRRTTAPVYTDPEQE